VESTTSDRRLAAILSADAVGYSRLMAEDEVATVRAVRAHHEAMGELIRRHGGRVVDSPGDNLLAEFPSVVEAVRCALAIQRDNAARDASLPPGRRMRFRIGIHLGDVLAEGDRIYGDGVNVAARLEAMAEPGGVCVSDAVYQQVRRRLDVGFQDLGECEVKNIPDPVRVLRLEPESVGTKPPRRTSRRLALAAACAAALLVLLAAGVWLSWPAPIGLVLDLASLGGLPVDPPLPDEPSIVVLPFDNLSDDPEQGYLADGITEDVTAGLAGIPRIFVISRNSAFTYRGGSVNVTRAGRELGVRYVVEGSLRRAGERVRVTVQLIDATRDFHVWSERYDREIGDFLDLQTEITEQILAALDVEIQEAEFARLRRKPTRSLSAYEAYVHGTAHLRKLTRDGIAQASAFFERAIEIDPEFAAAYAGLAMTLGTHPLLHCPIDRDTMARVPELAERALALDPFEPSAHLAKTTAFFFEVLDGVETTAGITSAERAVALAPNSDIAHMILGSALFLSGRPLEAIPSFRRSLRLSPRPMVAMMGMLGHANYLAGRHDRGVEFYERARAANPDVIGARIGLAVHYASVGRREEARAVAQEVLRANPGCTAAHAAIVAPPRFRDDWGRWLRQAGFPDA
jgi:adenylate cyclase